MLGINYESSDDEEVAPVVKPKVRTEYMSEEFLIATNGNIS